MNVIFVFALARLKNDVVFSDSTSKWKKGMRKNRALIFQDLLCLAQHTIRKVKFLSKNSILTKTPTFSRVFHPNFFWQFFSWNQSCQQLKSPKPQHFHEFFTPQKIDNFLGKSKLNFWTKNDDFEQCVARWVVGRFWRWKICLGVKNSCLGRS